MGRMFETTELVGEESLLHLFKLECQEYDCIDAIFNRGVYKEANKNCHNVLDGTETFLPPIDSVCPINFLRKECIETGEISGKLSIRKSSVKTFGKTLQRSTLSSAQSQQSGKSARDAKISIWRYRYIYN